MDDVPGEYITSTVAPTPAPDRPQNRGSMLSFDLDLDAAAALHQEQQFHHELTLPNEVLQTVRLPNEDVFGTKTEAADLSQAIPRSGSASGEDSTAKLRALAAKNAYLTMSLEAAAQEIAARKAESQQLHVEVANTQTRQLELQVELSEWRQRHEQTLAELDMTRAQVQRLEAEMGLLAQIQSERAQLQRDLAAAREDAANRNAAAQSEMAELRSRLERSEAERSRLDRGNNVQTNFAEVQRLQARVEAQSENRQKYVQEMAAARRHIAELEALCRKLKPPGAA